MRWKAAAVAAVGGPASGGGVWKDQLDEHVLVLGLLATAEAVAQGFDEETHNRLDSLFVLGEGFLVRLEGLLELRVRSLRVDGHGQLHHDLEEVEDHLGLLAAGKEHG